LTDKKSKEVIASPIAAFSEANQSLAENLSVAQERNLKYAQSVFESTIALLKDHAESAHSMLEQWEQHVDPKVAESYLSFFRTPLNAYRQTLEVVGTASRQSVESFQKATESFEKAMQQGREQWEEAARQVQRTSTESEK
jgi:hypothetical protein